MRVHHSYTRVKPYSSLSRASLDSRSSSEEMIDRSKERDHRDATYDSSFFFDCSKYFPTTFFESANSVLEGRLSSLVFRTRYAAPSRSDGLDYSLK